MPKDHHHIVFAKPMSGTVEMQGENGRKTMSAKSFWKKLLK